MDVQNVHQGEHDLANDIRAVLTADMVYRRERKWPLVNMENKHSTIVERQEERFPGTLFILEKYRGKLTLCGGAVIRLLCDIAKSYSTITGPGVMDLDFFFHNVTVNEANSILEDCITYLVSIKRLNCWVRIERRKYVTNVVVKNLRGPYENQVTSVYQFIHRIYPSLDTVLGGFDIPYGMLAFDGNSIRGTPIAKWCIENGYHILDTTRRSLSYENRIVKYARRYQMKVFFPGLNMTRKKLNANHIISSAAEEILAVIRKNNLRVVNETGIVENPLIYLRTRLEAKTEYETLQCGNLIIYKENKVKWKRRLVRGHEGEPENLKKYSDYSDSTCYAGYIGRNNSSMIKCDNFEGVVAYVQYERGEEISLEDAKRDYSDLVNHPDVETALTSHKQMMNYKHETRRRTNLLGKFWNQYTVSDLEDKEKREEIRNVLNQYVREESHRMCEELTGNSWITENPTRQWTSSFNPIMEDPRKFYGDRYIPFYIGIPSEIETTLRLGLRDKGSSLSRLNKDVFNLILRRLIEEYMVLKDED